MAADFTIADVLEWARTKPADGVYRYYDPFNCALCQFLKDTLRSSGPRVVSHRAYQGGFWEDGWGEPTPYPAELEPALASQKPIEVDVWGEETFGALVKRLEALLPAPSDTWTKANTYLADIEQVTA
jgi:hypothetical protein